MPYLVRDRLFIGNIGAAAEVLTATGGGEITHVLSLLSSASISFFSEWKPEIVIPTEEIEKVFVGDRGPSKRSLSPEKLLYSLERAGPDLGIRRMAVPLRDTEDEDLLDYLEVCLDFIDEGRKEGAVLVHCFAGVSRSAAIITAYLMRTEQRSQEDALESLHEVCEFVCPNDGFLEQLKLFEEMGFKVDTANPLYKRFRLKVLGHAYKQGAKVDSSIFETDPGVTPESNSSEGLTKGDKARTVYRCKKCRRVVAVPENIVSHTPGEGETCFEWQKRKSSNPYNRFGEVECTSMFVEPLRWMTSVEEGALEGKLSCVKCDARLGYFNWSGIQCSCGSWITPAFQIHKNKNFEVQMEVWSSEFLFQNTSSSCMTSGSCVGTRRLSCRGTTSF
ncbi:dual specificity protein phosphatase 12 isoform X1 [Iris pallida]|uniref:protein-tyrosine-phosphatase n=1 Tax=Iris pallida TaxID=29817 RepID=A0AAX6EFM3_IRIPA|nr:dual specificity protein phosphatase 12 isoform X1 [Iris pallida]